MDEGEEVTEEVWHEIRRSLAGEGREMLLTTAAEHRGDRRRLWPEKEESEEEREGLSDRNAK